MRDTSKDSEVVSNIWRWIHNNIPDEPSTAELPQPLSTKLSALFLSYKPQLGLAK